MSKADRNTVKRLDRWMEDQITAKELQIQSGTRREVPEEVLKVARAEQRELERVRATLQSIHREESS